MVSTLTIKDLRVSVEGKLILKGLSLEVKQGEIHALMGPNGSGKSTLAYSLMGHPKYEVEGGEVWFKGQNILELPPDERARLGLFLAFQYPTAIPGVSMANFLRTAVNAVKGGGRTNGNGSGQTGVPVAEFRKMMAEKMELLQMDMLEPEIAIRDETDSGLDIDALRIVANGVNALAGPDMGALVITHYQRILNYIKPDFVHVMVNGQIVASGGADLAQQLEVEGYDRYVKQAAATS
jgi:Fe-S cluster assembly ATP-binding protein